MLTLVSVVLGIGKYFALRGRRAACFLRLSCCIQLERSCVSVLFPSLYMGWQRLSVLFVFVSAFFFSWCTCVAPVALLCVLMTMSRAVVVNIAVADESDYVLMMVMLW